jgi:hypothetical protein
VYHASGYDGPTCLLIKCMGSGTVLGACVHERWRESNRFYGRYGYFARSLKLISFVTDNIYLLLQTRFHP